MTVRVCNGCGREFTPPEYTLKRKTGRAYSYCNKCVQKKVHQVRIRALIHLSTNPPVCVRCGFSDWRALQIDHIHGGGSKEYASTRSVQLAYKILRTPQAEARETYQILCANCNWIKRYKNKEHN